MREAYFLEGTSSVMNSYRQKVERIIKEEKMLAEHKHEKQGSDKYQEFLEETFRFPLSSSKAEKVQRSSQVLANLWSQWLVSCQQNWVMQRSRLVLKMKERKL